MAVEALVGFHGTDSANVVSIQKDNFIPSKNNDDWLGSGVYFFIDGICTGELAASDWAEAEAWDGEKLTYTDYSVLSAAISGDRVLDLRNDEDLIAFNNVRKILVAVYKEKFKVSRAFNPEHDNIMMNLVFHKMKLDIVISNMYVQNTFLRKRTINSRIPNVTILCVKKPDNIEVPTIEVVKEGSIEV